MKQVEKLGRAFKQRKYGSVGFGTREMKHIGKLELEKSNCTVVRMELEK
jgi:hypothetical protein